MTSSIWGKLTLKSALMCLLLTLPFMWLSDMEAHIHIKMFSDALFKGSNDGIHHYITLFITHAFDILLFRNLFNSVIASN